MDYNSHGTQQDNSGNNILLGVASTTLGVMSLLFTLCVPWLTCVFAAAGLACGIISCVRTNKEGGQLTLPIIGTIVSGISLVVATLLTIAFYTAISTLNTNYNDIDQKIKNMQDSLQQWDTLYFPEYYSEPDSAYFMIK